MMREWDANQRTHVFMGHLVNFTLQGVWCLGFITSYISDFMTSHLLCVISIHSRRVCWEMRRQLLRIITGTEVTFVGFHDPTSLYNFTKQCNPRQNLYKSSGLLNTKMKKKKKLKANANVKCQMFACKDWRWDSSTDSNVLLLRLH